jgi:hypothetical protein
MDWSHLFSGRQLVQMISLIVSLLTLFCLVKMTVTGRLRWPLALGAIIAVANNAAFYFYVLFIRDNYWSGISSGEWSAQRSLLTLTMIFIYVFSYHIWISKQWTGQQS